MHPSITYDLHKQDHSTRLAEAAARRGHRARTARRTRSADARPPERSAPSWALPPSLALAIAR